MGLGSNLPGLVSFLRISSTCSGLLSGVGGCLGAAQPPTGCVLPGAWHLRSAEPTGVAGGWLQATLDRVLRPRPFCSSAWAMLSLCSSFTTAGATERNGAASFSYLLISLTSWRQGYANGVGLVSAGVHRADGTPVRCEAMRERACRCACRGFGWTRMAFKLECSLPRCAQHMGDKEEEALQRRKWNDVA